MNRVPSKEEITAMKNELDGLRYRLDGWYDTSKDYDTGEDEVYLAWPRYERLETVGAPSSIVQAIQKTSPSTFIIAGEEYQVKAGEYIVRRKDGAIIICSEAEFDEEYKPLADKESLWKRYRDKPRYVQAYQAGMDHPATIEVNGHDSLSVAPGEWVVRDSCGETNIMGNEYFEEIYELVEEE